jgi:poly(A) polymerase
LLGRSPKDFDIATSAHPGEVRSLFRNCRLIGRRFRLAHVFFRGGKIIEVATFRANPLGVGDGEEQPDDLLITRDNVFGTAEQDARRRDFSVNGLFYDIQLGRVIDYAEGLRDLAARTIRTIGNPEVRMREDPVRILRAVRFASRLEFEIDPATYAALEGAVEDLSRCAPPRVLEEVFKLLRGGHSRRSFELLHALGALKLLLPPVGEHLERTGDAGAADLFGRLGVLDARVQAAPVDDAIIIAVMLHPLVKAMPEATEQDMSPGEAVDALLEQMVQSARLPRRMADRARMLLWAEGIISGERRRRRSLASFRRHPVFPDALALFSIGVEATGTGGELLERWREGKDLEQLAQQHPPAGDGRRKRRRRRRRRGGGEQGSGEQNTPEGSQGPPPESAPG